MTSNNPAQHENLINPKPFYFPPMEHKWSNDDYGNGSYRTSVFHDLDGSVSGVPGSFILINDENDALAIDQACQLKPTWNAAVCKGDVGRLALGGPGGGPPGIPGAARGAPGAGLARGPAAGPGAAAAPRPGAGSGGPAFGRPSGPPQPPVVLSRNGKALTLAADT